MVMGELDLVLLMHQKQQNIKGKGMKNKNKSQIKIIPHSLNNGLDDDFMKENTNDFLEYKFSTLSKKSIRMS